jgi:hypothetical protein
MNELEECRQRKGRKNYTILRNDLKKKGQKEYFESTCDEIVAYQRTVSYDLMYMKKKKVAGKKIRGFKTLALKTQENIIIDQRQVLKILEN